MRDYWFQFVWTNSMVVRFLTIYNKLFEIYSMIHPFVYAYHGNVKINLCKIIYEKKNIISELFNRKKRIQNVLGLFYWTYWHKNILFTTYLGYLNTDKLRNKKNHDRKLFFSAFHTFLKTMSKKKFPEWIQYLSSPGK